MEASEENRRKAQIAMSEITGFKFKKPDDSDLDTEWSKLYRETLGKKYENKKYENIVSLIHKDSIMQWIYRIAAIILMASIVGISLYQYEETTPSTKLSQIVEQETISTNDSQQKTLKFTHGSKVAKIVMNSNSTLTYDVDLLKELPINVTLQGEAFFDVEKGFSENPAFSVTTTDGIIEDIGTKFLVTLDKNQSRVVLLEGMVNVRTTNDKKVNKEFQVKKGELVNFNNKGIVTKEKVNSTFYTSWATGYIEFDQTKLSTFAEFIERRFGVPVQIADPKVADLTIDGAAYFKTLEELMRSVSDITIIPVYQSTTSDTVILGQR